MIKKIISGGQTGTEIAALDAAIKLSISHGGWIPKYRLNEDGPLPEKYNLTEMTTSNDLEIFEKHIADSDGTLVISHGEPDGGSKISHELAIKHIKPFLHINFQTTALSPAASRVYDWVLDYRIETLNVTGSRSGKDRKIYSAAFYLVSSVLLLSIANAGPGSKVTDYDKQAYLEKIPLPKTVESAVDVLWRNLTPETMKAIAGFKKQELYLLDKKLGTYIRKEFKLMEGKNTDLMTSCCELAGRSRLSAIDASSVVIGNSGRAFIRQGIRKQ